MKSLFDFDAERSIRQPRLYGWQEDDVHFVVRRDGALVAHDMGLGKAQPLSAKLLTLTGWKTMGVMRVGDVVVNGDGGVLIVRGVYPQGVKEVYVVRFTDGSITKCCIDHLWAVRTPTQKYRGQGFQIMSLGEIVDAGLKWEGVGHKWFIPMVNPVEFPVVDVPLDPYLLGSLLGDGSMM